MILLLRKATHDDGGNRPLHALDAHREPAAMDGIITRRLAQLEPRLEGLLVAHAEQVVARPRAPPEPEHEVSLALHPVVVLGHGAGSRRGVEEQLLVVREDDVDDGRLVGDLPQSVSEDYADLEGVVRGEVWQGQF